MVLELNKTAGIRFFFCLPIGVGLTLSRNVTVCSMSGWHMSMKYPYIFQFFAED